MSYELKFSEACLNGCPRLHQAMMAELGRQALGLIDKSDKFISRIDLAIAVQETFEEDASFAFQNCAGPNGLECGRGNTQSD